MKHKPKTPGGTANNDKPMRLSSRMLDKQSRSHLYKYHWTLFRHGPLSLSETYENAHPKYDPYNVYAFIPPHSHNGPSFPTNTGFISNVKIPQSDVVSH